MSGRTGRTGVPLVIGLGAVLLTGGLAVPAFLTSLGVTAQMATAAMFLGGSILGSILFAEKSKTGDMPQAASFPVQRSNKGTPIPKIYGTVRVAGNVLWLGENHPWVTKKSSGGGKGGGGGGSVVTGQGNRRSFLIGICEGPAIVLRIWRNKELISLSSATIFSGDGSADTGINALTGEDYSNYPNMCCAFFSEFETGGGSALPNFTFEVTEGVAAPVTYIPIYTAEEFNNIRNDMSATTKYVLRNDITLFDPALPTEGYPDWVPLGDWSDKFLCELDGNGFTVNGMTSTTKHELGNDGTGAKQGAGLIGVMHGFVHDITVNVNITVPSGGSGIEYVGGLCATCFTGTADETKGLTRVKTTGTITGTGGGGSIGGMVGEIERLRANQCVSEVSINISGFAVRVGGFVGEHDIFGSTGSTANSILTDCYATGSIDTNMTNRTWAGGFVGHIGAMNPTNDLWTNCYASGDVDGNSSGPRDVFIGGFAGNCVRTKVVDYGFLVNCFGYGAVSGTTAGGLLRLGGFIGVMELNRPQEINCHYKDNGNDADSLATKQVDSYFKAAASGVYTGATIWNFENVWKIDEGVGLPTLRWVGVFFGSDENPSVIIKDLLTNTRYGASIDESTFIDTDSFDAIETYCDANGLRFSFVIDSQKPVLDWIDFINSHFQGYLYMSQGKIHLGIFKQESSVFSLTQGNLVVDEGEDPAPPVSIKKRTYSETFNRVEVSWKNRAKEYDTSIVIAQDEVDQRTSGKIRKKTIQLIGITNAALAQRMAYSLLFDSLYRFSIYNFTLSYKNMLLEVGDVVTLSDGGLIVNQLIRITSIEEAKDGRGLVVEAIEDKSHIYAQFTYLTQDTEHVPDSAPTLADASAGFVEDLTTPTLGISIVPGGEDTNGWHVYKSYDDSSYELIGQVAIDGVTDGDANSTGLLQSNLPAHTAVVYKGDESFLVDIGLITDLDTAITDAQFFANQRVCKIGNELIGYKTCEETEVDGIWKVTGLIRGLLGTEAVAHSSGETFFTLNIDFNYIYQDSDVGQTLYFKFLTFQGTQIQSISDVSGISHVVSGKYKRPMPLSLMRIQDREGLSTYEKDDVVISFYFGSKIAGFNLGGFGDVLWNTYEADITIQTMNAILKQIDDTEILNSSFDISDIGEPMALLIEDADRDGNNPYKVEMNAGAAYSGIGSREIEIEKT